MQAAESKQEERGWGELVAGANAVRSVALAGGVALHAVNVFIATTILPSVVQDIGGLGYYAWNTTVFIVASVVAAATSAKLLRTLGPRGAYAAAAIVFMTGTTLCATATVMPMMLLGRAVQGTGGGFLLSLSYVMIRIVFEEALWPRAVALVSGMWGVATLIGPAVGGVFAQMHAWRWAFWSLLPVSALFACLAWFVMPSRPSDGPSAPSPVPLLQLVLLATSVLAVSIGSVDPRPLWNAAGLVGAAVLMLALIRIESRAEVRLLPRGALRASTPLGASYATMALLTALMNCDIFVPYFIQNLHGQSPLVAGYISALLAAGWTVGSVTSSSFTGARARAVVIAGPVLATVSMVALAVLIPTPSGGSWTVLFPICAALGLVGLGIGLGWPHILSSVLRSAPKEDQDVAAASITTIEMFATALGAAVAGMVTNLAGFTDPDGESGARHAGIALFITLGAAPLLAVATAVRVGRTSMIPSASSPSH
ncbi:MFS transporter [Pendulispora albinea]|uniref:MFS transporter n=1 Tax=Pendulispora albinea TaxID=2741071 RepID=A0ABZ2M1G2_9BACT